jgi:hypothetical protein
VIAWIGRVERGEALGVRRPVEVAAVDDDAPDRGAVPLGRTTMAAPWSNGRQIMGAAVLSMISGTPSSRPIAATSPIGSTVSLGLGKVSA